MPSNDVQDSVPLSGGGQMPILGFGTWQIQGDAAYRAVRQALDVGYRHIDTATVYGNEEEIGRAVEDSGIPREAIFLTTKVPPDRARRVRETFDSSLRSLRTDFVDLWLIHWPPSRSSSTELWDAMLKIRGSGAARAVGVSNYDVGEIDDLNQATGIIPAVNQIRWSPFLYDPGLVTDLRERGVVLEGYSPFKASRLRAPDLVKIAALHGVTPAQVVIRWHIQHGFVVIPKSVHPERIAENFAVFDFSLDPLEMARLDAQGRH